MGLARATDRLGDMLQGFGLTVPRITGAALILFLGYVLAKVAKKAVEAVITANHVERFSTQVGATNPTDPTMLPRTIGGIVSALIIIPVSIAALDMLNIAAISQPATAKLRIVLDAIAHFFAAGVILAVAYVIAEFASRLLTQFLATTGSDQTIGSAWASWVWPTTPSTWRSGCCSVRSQWPLRSLSVWAIATRPAMP